MAASAASRTDMVPSPTTTQYSETSTPRRATMPTVGRWLTQLWTHEERHGRDRESGMPSTAGSTACLRAVLGGPRTRYQP